MSRKGTLIMFIPATIALFIFIVVLIVAAGALVEAEPKIQMEAQTTVDKDLYQSHVSLNTLLLYDDGRVKQLIREYGHASDSRQEEIKSEIETILTEELSLLQGSRLTITFEDGSTIDLGEGVITKSSTVVATPSGAATVQLGVTGVGDTDEEQPEGAGSSYEDNVQ